MMGFCEYCERDDDTARPAFPNDLNSVSLCAACRGRYAIPTGDTCDRCGYPVLVNAADRERVCGCGARPIGDGDGPFTCGSCGGYFDDGAAFAAHACDDVIDLGALADAIVARGVPAFVQHTGGGVMTVYCGPAAVGPDGATRYAFAAGPGFARRDADGAIRSWASAGDFSYGPEDDSGDGITTTTADIDVLADAIADAARDAAVFLEVRCPSCPDGWVYVRPIGGLAPYVCNVHGDLSAEECAAAGLDGSGRTFARSDWRDA